MSLSTINKGLVRCLLAGLLCFAFIFKGSGQNQINGNFSGGFGSFVTLTGSAGTSQITTRNPGGTGNQYFRMVAGGQEQSPSAGCVSGADQDVTVGANSVFTAANNNCTNGAYFINCPNTSDNYVFKTPSTTGNQFVYFRIQGTVSTVTSVAQNPLTAYVQSAAAVSITANLSTALSTGQAVYLRYTSNGFATSTVVSMTGAGTTYTGTIPAGTNTAGATVTYYVFTSGTANVAADGSNADWYTINLNNNGGSNYSYTVPTPSTIYLHNFNDGATASPYNTQPTATTGTPTGIFNAALNTSSWVSSTGGFSSLAGASGTSLSLNSVTGAQTYTLTFNTGAGYQTSITSFNFWTQKSGTGPTNWSMSINSTTVGSGTLPAGAAIGTTNVASPITNATGTITVVLTLTGGTGGTFRLDDFTLNGFVTPTAVTAPSITGFTVAAPGAGSSGYVGNVITVTGSGFVGTTQVRVGGSGGTIVTGYTVVNNTTITFPAINASGTIYVLNGAGNATSAGTYTNLGYISTAAGDWNTGATWLGGAVPVASATVTVAHTLTLSAVATNNPANVTITAVGSLTLNTGTASIAVITNLTNNGTLAFSAAATLTFSNNASFVNNNTFTAGTGFVSFLGIGTVTGTVVFNNVAIAGGVNFGVSSTVNGSLFINNGGFLSTNQITYGSASTLTYNTTSAPYNIGLEWTGGNGVQPTVAGLGVPANVSITNTNNVTTAAARGMAGNLSITNGNLTIGNDLFISGNWSRTGGGAFTPSGRAVWFNGAAAQTISTAETFNFLLINNSNTSGVAINTGITVVVNGTTGDPLQLLNTGPLNINGTGSLSVNGVGGNIRVTGGVRTINFGAATATMIISGTKTVASTTGGTLSITSTVSGGQLQISTGVDFGAGLTTIQSNAFLTILNGGFVNTNPVIYATGSTLSFRTGVLYTVGTTDKTWTPGTSGAGVPDRVELNLTSTIVTLSDDRTARSAVTINSGNTLNNNTNVLSIAAGITTAATAFNMVGGTFNNGGGTCTIGATGGGNQTFNMGTSATLNLTAGTINLNGNLLSAGVFNQSGGLFAVDGNSGTAGTSVAQGTDHFAFTNTTTANCTAGTIRIIDPPHSSYTAGTTRSVQLRGVVGSYLFSGTHTFEFGDGTSTTPGNADGFVLESFAGTNRIAVNNVTVNAGNVSGRWLSTSYGTSASNGTYIQGNLTINTNAEMRIGNTGSVFSLAGNLVNNGTLTSTASNTTFLLASVSAAGGVPAANANAQTISGSGTFRNATTASTASFSGLTINNSNAAIPAVTFNIGNFSFSGTLTLTAGVVEPGSANDISFTTSGTIARSSGYVLRSGTGYMKKDITGGATNFTFMIGDNTGTAEYSPVTLSFTANSVPRTVGVRVTDAAHPQLNNPTTAVDYLTRYWGFFESGAGGTYAYTAAMTYLSATDPVGVQANLTAAYFTGANWLVAAGSVVSPVLTSGTLTESTIALNGLELTGRAYVPTNFTWVGSTSSDYNTGSNWDLGTVPSAGDGITINTNVNNPCIISTGTVNISAVTISGTGDFRMGPATTFNISSTTVIFSSSIAPTLDCTSTISFSTVNPLTIPAWNYGNLANGNGSRTWSVGTTGICNTFTPGAGVYTAPVGSTVNYSSAAAQTIQPVFYYNLSNSGNGPRTYTAGTIDIANVFTPSTGAITTGSANTINFSNTGAQIIPTTVYYNITNTGNGNRTLAATGANSNKISIGNTFALGTGTYTVTNSTVEYTGIGTYTMIAFTYHNLIFNSAGAGIFNFPTTGNITVNNDLTLTTTSTSSTLNVGSVGSTSKTLGVSGNVLIQNGGILGMVSLSTSIGGTANITGNLTVTGTGKIRLESTAAASGAGAINVNGNFTSTGTSLASSGANGIVDWGAGANLSGNGIFIKGNFNHSGTGSFGTSGTGTPAGFVFNNTGTTQTLSYTGSTSQYTPYAVASGAFVQLSTGLTLGSAASPASTFTLTGTLDCGTQVVTATDAVNNTFVISANGTLRTANASGVTGSLSGFGAGKITGASGIYQFSGSVQNTGFPANITTANGIEWMGSTSLTFNQNFAINSSAGNFNFTNNGLIYLSTFNLTLPASASIIGSGFSAAKMFVADNTGTLIKSFTSAASFTWPIGETTGTSEYSPVTLNVTTGLSGSIGFRVVDAIEPNNAPATQYLSRYWVASTTLSSYSWTGSFSYVAADIVGTESNLKLNIYDPNPPSVGWTEYASSSAASNVLTVTGGPGTGSLNNTDITARVTVPLYYRSIASGPWATASSWETSSDPAFISPAPTVATTAPNNANSFGITIRNTHLITIGSTVTADDLSVASGGTLTVGASGNLSLANGTAANDLVVDGTFNVNNTTTLASGTGTLVNGLLRSTVSPSSFGTITVSSTGIYEHAIDGGTVPACIWNPATPGIGATLRITGMNGSSTLGGLTQNFYHLEFNNASQTTASLQILGDINTVNGNLTMANSGTRQVRLFGNNPATNLSTLLTINGNLNITGGTLGLMNSGSTGTASCTIRVKGNVNISGGSFDLTGSSANTGTASNLEIEGNLTVSGTGTLIKTQTGTAGNVTFLRSTASPVQSFTSTAAGVNTANINWFVGTGASPNTVQMASNWAINAASTLTVRAGATLFAAAEFNVSGGTFVTASNGTLKIGSQYGITTGSGATSGNIQTTTRTYTAGCNFTYGSTSSNQSTGNGLPATITGILAIDNTGGVGNNTVTLLNTGTTATTFNLNNGLFAAGSGQQLNFTSGGTVNGNGGDFVTGATAGILNFPGTGLFTGNCNPYNVYASGAVNFGTGTVTIQNAGTFRLNAGGSAITNAPFYAVGSTLQYNSGGTYARTIEWSAQSGRGYPHHVNIQNATTLDLSANGDADRACGGDLTLGGTGAGTLTMNAMTSDLYVRGNVIVGNTTTGTLTMSSVFGADLYIGKNWTRTNTGTFNHNFRAVFFNGTTGVDQVVDATAAGGLETFPYLIINKSDNKNLVLATGTNILNNGGNGVGTTFELLNGGLDLNKQTFTYITYGNGINGFNIDGNAGNLTRYVISTGGQGTFAITNNDASQRIALINRKTANAALLNFDANVLVTVNATGAGFGGVDFGNAYTTIAGILRLNNKGFVSTNPPTYATNSLLQYNSTGTYNRSVEWSTSSGPGYPYHVQVSNTTSLDLGNAAPSVAKQCAGNLMIDDASMLSMNTTPMTAALTVLGNVTIGTGTSGSLVLSTLTGGELNVGGNWTRNTGGIFTANDRNVSFIGATASTITAAGGETFPYLLIAKNALANSVTLADDIVVSKALTLTTGTFTLSNKNVTIPSNASFTASVRPVVNPANVSVNYNGTGKFFIQRYLPARRAWRLMAAPFNPASGGLRTISEAWQEGQTDFSSAADTVAAGFATQITGGSIANGFDQSSNNNSSIKYFSAGSWLTPSNTNNTGVNSKEGWMVFVRGDRKNYGVITNQYKTPTITTLRPRGQINIGNKSLTSTGLTVVGNPYASAVDYTTLTKTGALAGTNTYYMWDPYLGGTFGVGAFVTLTWNGTVFVPSVPLTGTGTSSIDNRYIPSGAAILVDFGTGGTLTFKESDKNNSGTTVAFRATQQLQTVLHTVEADGSTYVSDGNLVLFGDQFRNDVNQEDAIKPANFSENFGLMRQGKVLSVERRTTIQNRDTIFFNLAQPRLKNYRLQFILSQVQAGAGTAAYLEDSYLQTATPVNMQDTTWINFAVTNDAGSYRADRFRLVFKPSVSYADITADVVKEDIKVNWQVIAPVNIIRYEVERSNNNQDFITVANVPAQNNGLQTGNYNWLDVKPTPGIYYYRIKSTDINGVVAYSKTVQVSLYKGTPEMYVFPNPIQQHQIKLQMNDLPEGKYHASLIAADGSTILQRQLIHTAGTGTHLIEINKKLAPGIYILKVIKPSGQDRSIEVLVP